MDSQAPTGTQYGFGTTLDLPFEAAIEAVTAALKAEGFGVLTTIDVQTTLRDKLGTQMDPYVILGACNPRLAHRGIQAEPELGLLLPCNVILREVDGASVVSIVDPGQMLGVVGDNAALSEIAEEAGAALRRVLDALRQ